MRLVFLGLNFSVFLSQQLRQPCSNGSAPRYFLGSVSLVTIIQPILVSAVWDICFSSSAFLFPPLPLSLIHILDLHLNSYCSPKLGVLLELKNAKHRTNVWCETGYCYVGLHLSEFQEAIFLAGRVLANLPSHVHGQACTATTLFIPGDL